MNAYNKRENVYKIKQINLLSVNRILIGQFLVVFIFFSFASSFLKLKTIFFVLRRSTEAKPMKNHHNVLSEKNIESKEKRRNRCNRLSKGHCYSNEVEIPIVLTQPF